MTELTLPPRDDIASNEPMFSGSSEYRWVVGSLGDEGDRAYALLGEPDAGGEIVLGKTALRRGDLVKMYSAPQVRMRKGAKDGKDYVHVTCKRRSISGWVREDALDKDHPLVTLAYEIQDDGWQNDGTLKKDGAPADAKERHLQTIDKTLDEKGCSNGASEVQNWMRKGIPAATMPQIDSDKYIWADDLRTKGPRKDIEYYYDSARPHLPVTDPDKAWVWPGDLIVMCLPRRLVDGSLVHLTRGDYKTLGVDRNPATGQLWAGDWEVGWSGHIATVVKLERSGKNVTNIYTIDGHMGGTKTPGTTHRYSADELRYRGCKLWGFAPPDMEERTKRGEELDPSKDTLIAEWKNWWYYRYARYDQAAKLDPPMGSGLQRGGELTKAIQLWNAECKARGIDDHLTAAEAYDLCFKSKYAGDSGLEIYGIAYWKENLKKPKAKP